MMNPAQMDQFRASMWISQGTEWEPFAGMGDNAAAQLKAFVDASVLASKAGEPTAEAVPVPARLPVPEGAQQSTQGAFGNVLLGLAKSGELLGDRIVTTAPDVTQTTNLGAFVNQRGLFRRSELPTFFVRRKSLWRRNGRRIRRASISNLVLPRTTFS